MTIQVNIKNTSEVIDGTGVIIYTCIIFATALSCLLDKPLSAYIWSYVVCITVPYIEVIDTTAILLINTVVLVYKEIFIY